MDDDVYTHACCSMMIPSDIITQILYRLPSESVGRFRCVSKDWLSLLTQPEFITTHRKTLNRNHHLFYNHDILSRRTALYSHPFHHHDPYILNPTKLPIDELLGGNNSKFQGSCDGLVLLSGCSDDTLVLLNPTTREYVQLPHPAGYYPRDVYLINPTTRKYVQLPQSAAGYGSPLDEMNQEHVRIESTHGIGYDLVTDDYKVITLTYFEYHIREGYGRRDRITGTTLRLSIYSVKSNTWRQLIVDSPNYDCRYSSPAVYVNGFLHWFGTKKDTDSQVIVAFSLADECFSEVPSPESSCRCSEFVVVGGKLAVYVTFESKWSRGDFEVWLMNEYGVKESWTKIPLDVFNDDFRLVNYMIFDDNGKIRVAGRGQMLIYDFEKGTFSKNIYAWSWRFRLFGSYVESLVSPQRKDATNAKQIPGTQNVGSEAKRILETQKLGLDTSEAALEENLDPIYCHLFCNKSLRFAKILNDKKASLRKKEREERNAKVKNKRKRVQKSKGRRDLTNNDVSLGDSS